MDMYHMQDILLSKSLMSSSLLFGRLDRHLHLPRPNAGCCYNARQDWRCWCCADTGSLVTCCSTGKRGCMPNAVCGSVEQWCTGHIRATPCGMLGGTGNGWPAARYHTSCYCPLSPMWHTTFHLCLHLCKAPRLLHCAASLQSACSH